MKKKIIQVIETFDRTVFLIHNNFLLNFSIKFEIAEPFLHMLHESFRASVKVKVQSYPEY